MGEHDLLATPAAGTDEIGGKRKRLFDSIWLIALALYVLAGVDQATFHGDESLHVYGSHDYATLFLRGAPGRLSVGPPYVRDSDAHLRLASGSVSRYAIGLSWHLAGIPETQLPGRPGWRWGLGYTRNVETGHRPAPALLHAARLPSALCLAASVVVFFLLARAIGGRSLAYPCSALYALHPVLLLNGRRALQEGPLLLFGLLAVLMALHLQRRRQHDALPTGPLWLGLILASGFALASKHSAAVFVATALGWLVMGALPSARQALSTTLPKLLAAGGATLAVFVVLSPGLWQAPLERLGDLVAIRRDLVDLQIRADPSAPTSLVQRLQSLVTQPFLAPPVHYEAPNWSTAKPIAQEIERFEASALSGIPWGPVLGVPLTLLAVAGVIGLIRPRLRGPVSSVDARALLAWLVLSALAALTNPLSWQRYFLPVLPVAILLAGLGGLGLWAGIRRISDPPPTPANGSRP